MRGHVFKLAFIPCDYCGAPASRFFTRGERHQRSLVCEAHRMRGLEAWGKAGEHGVIQDWNYPPLPGRQRYESLSVDELVVELRRQLPHHISKPSKGRGRR